MFGLNLQFECDSLCDGLSGSVFLLRVPFRIQALGRGECPVIYLFVFDRVFYFRDVYNFSFFVNREQKNDHTRIETDRIVARLQVGWKIECLVQILLEKKLTTYKSSFDIFQIGVVRVDQRVAVMIELLSQETCFIKVIPDPSLFPIAVVARLCGRRVGPHHLKGSSFFRVAAKQIQWLGFWIVVGPTAFLQAIFIVSFGFDVVSVWVVGFPIAAFFSLRITASGLDKEPPIDWFVQSYIVSVFGFFV